VNRVIDKKIQVWLNETEDQFALFEKDDIPSNANDDDKKNVKG
jgi:hypothetical protein